MIDLENIKNCIFCNIPLCFDSEEKEDDEEFTCESDLVIDYNNSKYSHIFSKRNNNLYLSFYYLINKELHMLCYSNNIWYKYTGKNHFINDEWLKEANNNIIGDSKSTIQELIQVCQTLILFE